MGSQTQPTLPEKREKLIIHEECELITLMDVFKGRLEVFDVLFSTFRFFFFIKIYR